MKVTIEGTSGAWICSRCVRRYQVLQIISLLLMVAVIGLGCLLLHIAGLVTLGYLTVGVCLGVCLAGWLVIHHGIGQQRDAGESLAIRLLRKTPALGKYDAFLTSRHRRRMRQSS